MKCRYIFLIYFLNAIVGASELDLIEIDADFKGEDQFNNTIYLSKENRKDFLITIKDGRVLNHDGGYMDTRLLPNGTAMFVLSKDNNLFISKKRRPLLFDHSSLVAGEDVICAGNVNINRGYIMWINDVSAMYDTGESEKPLRSVVKKLRLLNADLSKTRVFFQKNL